MAIEYKKAITFTKDSTIYGHQSLDEGGFPKDAGNGKVSQVLDLAENQTVDSLKSKISITIDLEDSRLYHFNIDGTSVATFEIPADRFLKSVTYDDVTKVLTFTFFTGSGEETVSVDLSSLVDTYTAGNGLTLSGGVFSIKLKSSETRLKVDSTGLYIDLSDILSKITAEETARKNADADLSGRIDTLTTTVEGIETRVDAKVTKAETAATNASNSATSASASATTATEKATAASNSASRASTSEANAKTSETNAKASEDNAKASEDNASASEANAKLSETNAKASETKAKTSETNAKSSETSASSSATKALASETNAKTSETNASTYAGQAKTSETNAKASETASKTYKEQAQSLLEQADLNLIESIKQTTTSTVSSGKNVITITQKDGTKSTFDVYNGAKGDTPTIAQASSSTAGIMKLFTALGQNTDGAPTNKAVQDAISAISLKMYPVGAIYMSVDSASPASFLGGTWEVLRDRFLVGAGNLYTVNEAKGEASHVLTEAEMPSHGMHLIANDESPLGIGNYSGYLDILKFTSYGNTGRGWNRRLDNEMIPAGKLVGGSQSHNNMPPYLAVYMWKRTA